MIPISMLVFPPSRELEAEIYHLGQHLEELQDHMDQTQREAELCSPDLQDNTRAMPFLSRSAHLPTPSGSFSSPAVHTNHEVLLCPITLGQSPFLSFIHFMLMSLLTYLGSMCHVLDPMTHSGEFSGDRRWRRRPLPLWSFLNTSISCSVIYHFDSILKERSRFCGSKGRTL